MAAKTRQLQIRVTPEQKASIRRLARRAGQSVSRYVLERVLPAERVRFGEILDELREGEPRFALAELHDLLAGLAPATYARVLDEADLEELDPMVRNYVAAMVEEAARRIGVDPPRWTACVEPLSEPWFPVGSPALRSYLLRVAPVAFKRRNLFVDATIGDRV